MNPLPLTRPIAILILTCVGLSFSFGHVAARLAFDQGTSVVTAVFFRSGFVVAVLAVYLSLRRLRPTMPARLLGWQLTLGLLLTVQSLGIYIAIAAIPIGIALLFLHTFAILLALITWALGGAAPTRQGIFLMLLCLLGLFLSLDVPALIAADAADRNTWMIGISAALIAALVFAFGLWITDNKLPSMMGAVRSFYSTLVILICTYGVGQTDLLNARLIWPSEPTIWLYVFLLSAFYGLAFIALFVLAPRLNMTQNAPALHIEPVSSLVLGWVILGQRLSPIQMVGGLCVVIGIMLIAIQRNTPPKKA